MERHPHPCVGGLHRALPLPLVVCLVLVVIPGRVAEAAGAAAEARRLQTEFKTARSAEERREIAAGLLELGADGGRRLHALARTDFFQRLPKYSAGFQRATAELLRQRGGKDDPSAEIAALRRTIREVADRADLTKEMIKRESDPALARLEQLLVVSAAEVRAFKPELAAERTELLLLAEWAERAVELVPEKDRGRLPPVPSPTVTALELDAADELAALQAGTLAPADGQTLAANAVSARDLDPEEARGIQRLNQIRILVGLSALAIDPGLVRACRRHSEDMSERRFFSHDSPVAGRETPWKRAQAAGTSARAENIATGTDSGPGAIQIWWHSPGHHKNMLGGHKRTGLGRYQRLWTQLFG